MTCEGDRTGRVRRRSRRSVKGYGRALKGGVEGDR